MVENISTRGYCWATFPQSRRKQQWLTKCLLCAKHCSKCFECRNSFNPPNPGGQHDCCSILLWGNWDTKHLSNLSKWTVELGGNLDSLGLKSALSITTQHCLSHLPVLLHEWQLYQLSQTENISSVLHLKTNYQKLFLVCVSGFNSKILHLSFIIQK